MARRTAVPAASTESSSERLSEAIVELAQNVRVLTELVERVRENLAWLTRNGVPHQPLTLRIDPSSGSSSVTPQQDRVPGTSVSTTTPPGAELPVTVAALHECCEWLAEHFTALHEEQLNLILSAQEDVQRAILTAITRDTTATKPDRRRSPKPALDFAPQSALAPPIIRTTPAGPPAVRQPRQLLFAEDEPRGERVKEYAPRPDSTVPPRPLSDSESCLPSVTLFEIGDAVEFTLDGREVWGEIVELQDAENTATVQMIPSEESVTVSQDRLQPERCSRFCGCAFAATETRPRGEAGPTETSPPQRTTESAAVEVALSAKGALPSQRSGDAVFA